MSNFLALAVGEITRMKKYQVLPATVFIALLWMGFLSLVDRTYVQTLFSLLIYVDVTTMAMLLVGVTLFFEKQEGTFRSFLGLSDPQKRIYSGQGNIQPPIQSIDTCIAYWFCILDQRGTDPLLGIFRRCHFGWIFPYHAWVFDQLLCEGFYEPDHVCHGLCLCFRHPCVARTDRVHHP